MNGPCGQGRRLDGGDTRNVPHLVDPGLLGPLLQRGIYLLTRGHFARQTIILKLELRRFSVLAVPIEKPLQLIFCLPQFRLGLAAGFRGLSLPPKHATGACVGRSR